MYTLKNSNYFRGPIKETGFTISISNPKNPFINTLNAALSSKAASTAAQVSQVSQSFAPNTSLRTHMSLRESNKMIQKMSHSEYLEFVKNDTKEMDERRAGTIKVPIGKGELLGLMKKIEQAAADGEHFVFALLKQITKHANPAEGVLAPGSADVDFLWICPSTGTVKDASPRLGMNHFSCIEFTFAAEDAVWDLAYDLQKFIQLRVFGNTEGLSEEEAEALIAEIKARQSEKCFARFIDFPDGFLCDCCAAADEDREREAKPDETAELIDGFIAAIEQRQRQEAENIEELKKIKQQMMYTANIAQIISPCCR